MAQWVGVQGQVKLPKKAKTPALEAVPLENPKPKTKKSFFSISTRRLAESVEGLNSSLSQSPGEL